MQLVDLTHSLHPAAPSWTGECGFTAHIQMDYDRGCRVMQYTSLAGIGTHMDAPQHFFPDTSDIASLPLEQLIVPLSLIDVSQHADPDYRVTTQDIARVEQEHGTIQPNSLVIANTGWSKRWDTPNAYRNPDSEGKMHFPGFSPAAVEYLLTRDIAGIGIDTLSPDGGDTRFPIHHLILGKGKYILENLTNLNALPPQGGYIIALPPKIQNGAEANLRVVALLPKR